MMERLLRRSLRSHDIVLSLAGLLAAVQIANGQSFAAHPESAKVLQGSSIILKCVVEDIQGATIQWTRNNFGLGTARNLPNFPRYRIIGAENIGEYNLLISNAQLEDNAVFQCQIGATATRPGVMSEKATVSILVPVPANQLHIDGGEKVAVVAQKPTNITCHANGGKPAATLTWKTGGSPVATAGNVYYSSKVQAGGDPDEAKLEDAVSHLTVTASKLDQGKAYECEATSEAMNTPKRAWITLEVQYPPEVTMKVNPIDSVMENSDIKFTCSAVGNPSEITWKWYVRGEVVAEETSDTFRIEGVGYDMHSQKVACEATNAVGSTQQSYTLHVQYAPRFKEAEHVEVGLGEDAILNCEVKGNPTPAIVWRKKGDESNKIWGSQKTLPLNSVTDDMFGIYICEAWVLGFEEKVSMEVHLLKKSPPKVLGEHKQSARFGDDTEVVCVVRSIPKPTSLTWMKDGEQIDVTKLERYYLREEDLPDGKKSILEIQSVQDSDFGTYNCSVQNEFGHDSGLIEFTEKKVVPVAYILAGVLVGILIIVVIVVVVFFVHRRKSRDDAGSDSSESTITKKTTEPDVTKVDHADGLYGSHIDAWRRDLDPNYRHSAEYDELSYPNRDPRAPSSLYDYRDGYGNYGYNNRDYGNYGTYPGPASSRMFDPRYNDDMYAPYPGSEYGSFRPPPPGPGPDYPAAPPPPEFADYAPPSLSSRLSTNV